MTDPPRVHRADVSPRVLRAVCFACALALLAWGCGFDLDPFDSAELALAARTAGLAHPPGQPLHTLLGWLLTRMTPSSLALPALALLSLVPCAWMFAHAASSPAFHTARSNEVTSRDQVSLLAALTLALVALVPCAIESVRQSVCRVEVYALAAVCASGAVHLALRGGPRDDVLAGLLLGLAFATNPVLAAQGVGALGVIAARPGRVRALSRVIAGGLAGLLVFAYAFVVAPRVGHTLVWGAPHDLRGFIAMLAARDFQNNVRPTSSTFLTNLGHLSLDQLRSGVLVWIALGALALAMDPRAPSRWQRLAALVAALVLGDAMIALNVPYRPNNPDYGGYVLVPLALATYANAAHVHRVLTETMTAPRHYAYAALALGAVIAGRAMGIPRPGRAARALATHALTHAPPHAVIVLESDHLLFPALYLQHSEGLRRDVLVLNTGWASASWAWSWARAQRPDLSVDLTPGVGGHARLVLALRALGPTQAILAERPALLADIARGEVCARGLLWSNAVGCTDARDAVVSALHELSTIARANDPRSWDARMAETTARSMGDAALWLGCRNAALRWYEAGLGQLASDDTRCGHGAPLRIANPPGVMDITRDDVAFAHAFTLRALTEIR